MNKCISNKIKYLYWILTLGMVMYHARWIDYFNIKYLNILDRKALSCYFLFAEHIGTVCMTFFFFMSAFWFYRNLESFKDIAIRWKKRFYTLLIPFLLWTLILGSYKIINSEIVLHLDNLFYYLFETPVAGPLWYILGLLMLQFLAPILILCKKNRKLSTIFFVLPTIYCLLRNFHFIPHLLSFENWWWYDNLIYYLPAYLLGAYIGLHFPKLLLEKEYRSKYYTVIGLCLVAASLSLWYFYPQNEWLIFYSMIELLGIWFVLKSSWFTKAIPYYISCEFYMFALHNPILIPKTKSFFIRVLNNAELCGLEIIFIKILQIAFIFLVSCLFKFLICKLLPRKVNELLTGGR